MRYLIITVAGTATRFNKDTEKDTLKCLYYQESPQYSLLYQLIKNCGEYNRYVIVGGYLYGQLEQFISENLSEFRDKIILVYNSHFCDFGSCYSLYKGIEAIPPQEGDITFVEGDLFFTKENFSQVYNSSKNVLTINREPIHSNKAVVLYISETGIPKYLYDSSHQALYIKEPFKAIFNSAQIWRFISLSRLKNVVATLSKEQLQGTNLEIIQAYFGDLSEGEYDTVLFDEWYNCNTVDDYNIVKQLM